MKLRMQQLFEALTTTTNPGLMEFDFECLKVLKEGRHAMCVLCGLTFELTWRRQQGAWAGRCRISQGACRPKRPAVGAQVERGVRQQRLGWQDACNSVACGLD